MEHVHYGGDKGPLGKLKWAGRASVEGTLTERKATADDARSDAKKWGLDLTALDTDDEGVGIWPENLPAVLAYLRVHTQWRVVGTAAGPLHAVGLDYPAVKIGLKLAGIKVTKDLWQDLQMVEIGARAAMNGVST